MKKNQLLCIWLLLMPLFLNAQMGHFPTTQIPTLAAPYTVNPNYLQNASYTAQNRSTISPSDIANIFVNYTEDTTNHNVILVYTTNGTAPTKTNGTQANMTFYNYTFPNRTWVGAIPAQPNGTIVRYVIYRNTLNTGLAAANRRTSSNNGGTETSSWTEGDFYFSYTVSFDSDGDGIANLVDLDDDNDGILDVTEGCNTPSIVTNGNFSAGNTGWSSTNFASFTNEAYYTYDSDDVTHPDGLLSQSLTGLTSVVNTNGYIPLKFDLTPIDNTTAVLQLYVKLNGVDFLTIDFRNFGHLDENEDFILDYSKAIPDLFNSAVLSPPLSELPYGVPTTVTLLIPSAGIPNNATLTFYVVNCQGCGTPIDDFKLDNISIECATVDTDGDTIPDSLDFDSDNDECSDANEAYNSSTAQGNDGNMYYGTGNPPAVNANGTVTAASYAAPNGNYLTEGSASTISMQPTNQSTTVGGNTSLTVTASSGSGTRQYQWQVSTDDGANWNVITNTGVYSNATTATLTITGATAIMNGYLFKVVITQSDYICGNTISSSAKLCVIGTPIIGTITQPTCSIATGSVVLSGLPSGSWTINPGAIAGSGTSTTISNLAIGNYNFTVTNAEGCTSIGSDNVVINAALQTVAGTISSNQSICSGSEPSDLILTGNTGAVVKWQKSSDALFTSPIDIASTATTLSGVTIGALNATTYFRAVVQQETCTIENSNTILISVPHTTWDGTAWSNGEPTITTTAYMTGNYSLATDLFACTLIVSNNAIVSIPSGYDVTINGKLTVDIGSNFTLNNNANILQQTEVVNSGTISVKRYTAPLFRLDYNLWSSPLIGSQTLSNFSPSTSNIPPTNIRFYTYNTNTNLYNSVTPTSTTFDPAKGYLIRMPNNWISYGASATPASWLGTFTGTPRNGALNYTLVNTGTTTSYNAVGNPYPSALLLDNFITDNSSNIEGTLWFWRKWNDNNNLVSYSTCSTIGCTLNNNASYSDDNLISIGQGFIVKAKTGQTNVNFTNSMRSSANVNQFFKNNNTEIDRYWLKLTNTANISTGQNLIAYVPDATNSYDNGLDGLYLNDGSIAFYSIADTKEVVINARPSFDANDVIPLVFKTNAADTYTFSVNQKEGLFNGNQDIYIRDNFTNSVQNLTLGNYTFSSDIGEFTNRFDILYQNSLGVNETDFNPNQVIIYNKDETIYVNTGNVLMNSLKIFDVRGRLLFTKSEINNTTTNIKLDTARQMLLIQITSQNGQVITKKVMN